MKKIYTFLLVFLFLIKIPAQLQDLNTLSSGTLLSFTPLYNEDENSKIKLWGYSAMYDLGKADRYKDKREIVLLDKNLNNILSKEYLVLAVEKDGYSSESSYFNYVNRDTLVIRQWIAGGFLYKDIDIEKGTVSDYYVESDGEKAPLIGIEKSRDARKFFIKRDKLEKKRKEWKRAWIYDEVNYYTTSNRLNNEYKILYNFSFFRSKDSIKLWGIDLNKTTNKKSKYWEDISIFNTTDSNYVYFFRYKMYKDPQVVKIDGEKNYNYKFVTGIYAVDRKTGKLIYSNNDLEKEKMSVNNIFIEYRIIDEGKKLVFLLENIDDKTLKNTGYRKMELDLTTGKKLSDKKINIQEIPEFIIVNKRGKLEDGYKLARKSTSIHKDGSVAILYEKYKEAKKPLAVLAIIPIAGQIASVATSRAHRTEDMLLFNIDKDFNIKEVYTIKKDISKNDHAETDYLFDTYIKEGYGSAFFYADYRENKDSKDKSKKWILGILQIHNGEIRKEEIPIMERDKFSIKVNIAKEGYILLQESNEEEKYNQIRLEKLN